MPSKFYLHAASTTVNGTLPSDEQSSASPNNSAANATTLRTMDNKLGSSQTSASLSTSATTLPQRNLFAMFVSPPLAAGTYGNGTWTFNGAGSESNAASNYSVSWNGYFWRPSTGASVGTIRDNPNGSISTEPGTSQTAISGTDTLGADVTIQDGDVLVIEAWGSNGQSMGNSYTNTLFYDGTTEASTSNCATYFQSPTTIKYLGQGYGQSQAQIIASKQVYGQAQADIKATSQKFAQAQAKILAAFTQVVAQAQAKIIPTRVFGQSQAFVTKLNGLGQAQALINGTYTNLIDTFTRSVTDDFGTADVGGAYTLGLGAASRWNVNGSVGTIQFGNTFGSQRLKELLVSNGIDLTFKFSYDTVPTGQNADFVLTFFKGTPDYNNLTPRVNLGVTLKTSGILGAIYGDTSYTTIDYGAYTLNDTYIAHLQVFPTSSTRFLARHTIYKLGDTEAAWTNQIVIRSTSLLLGHVSLFTGSPTITPTITIDDLKVTSNVGLTYWAQAQAQISGAAATTTNAYAQAQANIKQTSRVYGQAQADIKAISRAYAQAQADTKQSYTVYAQGQAHINQSHTVYGQAQAFIYIPQISVPISDISNDSWVRVVV